MKTIFEKSQDKQRAYSIPKGHKAFDPFTPLEAYARKDPIPLPEVSELDLTRHFSKLASRNMGIDTHFYPLGSCTMKFNPRVNEMAAALPGFSRIHPLAPDFAVQGSLRVIDELVEILCGLSGMEAGTLIPNAGAQGELTGIKMIGAYHKSRGDLIRDEVLVPDSAHGTNPATASMAGFKTIPIRTNASGDIDLDHLKALCSSKTLALMLTNPNTLGLFSSSILEIASIVHSAGGLLYYDGANLNPLLHIARPGDMGFDVMHINLHKTFSTPHGGGGPGSGPVLCKEKLKCFLPIPRVKKSEKGFRRICQSDSSIGFMASFQGNFSIYLRAYLYAKLNGSYGLRKVAVQSVLNANYLKAKLGDFLTIPFQIPCMHEFVAQADLYLGQGIRALDIAKRLLDYGFHAPTIYFPLTVKEAMLIEPTETESKATLDAFIEAIASIASDIKTNPSIVAESPHTMPVGRLDEVKAAKKLTLKHSTIATPE